MLRRYEDAMRAAARLVADVDAEVRDKLVKVEGREERYTEKFVTLLDERLGGFKDGGIRWGVTTHIADKQSGQETRTGADLFISLSLNFDGVQVQKGIQAQAKINKNKQFGISVDSKPRLLKQCETMLTNSQESFVFLYGNQGTKIVRARTVVEALPTELSNLITDNTADFFFDFFVCKYGDRGLYAGTPRSLQKLVEEKEYKAAVILKAKAG